MTDQAEINRRLRDELICLQVRHGEALDLLRKIYKRAVRSKWKEHGHQCSYLSLQASAEQSIESYFKKNKYQLSKRYPVNYG